MLAPDAGLGVPAAVILRAGVLDGECAHPYGCLCSPCCTALYSCPCVLAFKRMHVLANDTTTCTNLSSLKSGWAQRSSRTQIVLCSLLVYKFCVSSSVRRLCAAAFTVAAVRAVHALFDYQNDRMCSSHSHLLARFLFVLSCYACMLIHAWAYSLTARVRHASRCIVCHAALASVDRC
jgi:hypothetical protein